MAKHSAATGGTLERPKSSRLLWVIVLIAVPAAVEVWASWVGLGSLCGFSVHIGKKAIGTGWTLAVGMETYGGLAAIVWLSAAPGPRSRAFAQWSALAAFGLSLLGQVAYHLMTAAGMTRAPAVVIAFVSCLPVLVIGFAAFLVHLVHADARTADAAAGAAGEAAAAREAALRAEANAERSAREEAAAAAAAAEAALRAQLDEERAAGETAAAQAQAALRAAVLRAESGAQAAVQAALDTAREAQEARERGLADELAAERRRRETAEQDAALKARAEAGRITAEAARSAVITELQTARAALETAETARSEAELRAGHAEAKAATLTRKLGAAAGAKSTRNSGAAAGTAAGGGVPATKVPRDFDAQAAALAILAEEPEISGAKLAERVGRSERWGQDFKKQLATRPSGGGTGAAPGEGE
jgi:hypothetical protein